MAYFSICFTGRFLFAGVLAAFQQIFASKWFFSPPNISSTTHYWLCLSRKGDLCRQFRHVANFLQTTSAHTKISPLRAAWVVTPHAIVLSISLSLEHRLWFAYVQSINAKFEALSRRTMTTISNGSRKVAQIEYWSSHSPSSGRYSVGGTQSGRRTMSTSVLRTLSITWMSRPSVLFEWVGMDGTFIEELVSFLNSWSSHKRILFPIFGGPTVWLIPYSFFIALSTILLHSKLRCPYRL